MNSKKEKHVKESKWQQTSFIMKDCHLNWMSSQRIMGCTMCLKYNLILMRFFTLLLLQTRASYISSCNVIFLPISTSRCTYFETLQRLFQIGVIGRMIKTVSSSFCISGRLWRSANSTCLKFGTSVNLPMISGDFTEARIQRIIKQGNRNHTCPYLMFTVNCIRLKICISKDFFIIWLKFV